MKLKSIFTKHMSLYMGILIVTFIILGGVLSIFYQEHFFRLKEQEFIEQGKKISDEYAKAFYTGVIDIKQLNYELEILEDYMDASVFFMNKNGEIDIVSSKIDATWVGQTINDHAISSVLEGKIVTVQGKIGGMFHENVLTIGYPIIVGKKTLGGIFMCTSIPEIQKSITDMYMAGFVAIVFAMAIGAVMIYFFSKKLSRPIVQMNHVARIISDGNFEKRIDITTTDEIGELAESFNNMAESLERQERTRRDFITNISHDLRSPLTSIQGFLNAILDGTIGEDDREHYLNVVLEETQRLTKLTNDIVDLSRAQSCIMELSCTEFDVNKLIRENLSLLEPVFKSESMNVKLILAEKETTVYADREKIKRVIQNLLENALKFTNTGGKIEIETTVDSEKKKVFVCIRDNGIGIDEEDRRHIFDRFFKADVSRGQDKKGGGVGLSIVKEFINAHGEFVTCKSVKGEGTEFIFTLKSV